jgi:hypothetical protein
LKSDLIKTGRDRCISVEFPNIKFCENVFSDSRVVTGGQTYGQTHGEKTGEILQLLIASIPEFLTPLPGIKFRVLTHNTTLN